MGDYSGYSYSKTNTVHLLYRDPSAPKVRLSEDMVLEDDLLHYKHYTCPYNTMLPTAEFADDFGKFIEVWNNYVNDPENKRSLRFAREVKPFDLIFVQRVKPADNGLILLLPSMKKVDLNKLVENSQSITSRPNSMRFKQFATIGKFPSVSCVHVGMWDKDVIQEMILNGYEESS